MTAGGGSIARLVPGNPVKRVLPSDLPLSFNLVRIKATVVAPEGGDAPPAVTVPAEGGDWGGGNPVALASSTYCRFTSVSALFRAAAVIFFHRPTPVDV